MHEFRANVAAVHAPRFFRNLARQFQIGELQRLENVKRV
jgi:hypothetical protein